MRNKSEKIKKLQSDLVKYSRQIGIIECEIPQLVFNFRDMQSLESNATDRLALYKHRAIKTCRYRGMTSRYTRTILVELMMRDNRSIKELRHTLIHELVHYRFMYLSHGSTFEKMIKLVLKGEQFPKKVIDIPQLGKTGC